jgi:hypothetical protein
LPNTFDEKRRIGFNQRVAADMCPIVVAPIELFDLQNERRRGLPAHGIQYGSRIGLLDSVAKHKQVKTFASQALHCRSGAKEALGIGIEAAQQHCPVIEQVGVFSDTKYRRLYTVRHWGKRLWVSGVYG